MRLWTIWPNSIWFKTNITVLHLLTRKRIKKRRINTLERVTLKKLSFIQIHFMLKSWNNFGWNWTLLGLLFLMCSFPFFINFLINKYKCVTFILNQMKFGPNVPRSHGKCTHILITELFDWTDQLQITVELTFYIISAFTLNKSSFLLRYSSVVPLYITQYSKKWVRTYAIWKE